MADNPLTLLCLVDGEETTHAFSVKIPLTDTVDDLKVHIKVKKADEFSDVDARKLTLWRVLVSDSMKDSRITIDLLGEKAELNDPGKSLSKLFPESPNDSTYILVQRLPPVHAAVSARGTTPPSTPACDKSRSVAPIKLKHVRYDRIEEELADILKGVSHHQITHSVDPKDVEASQKERLGPFYKRTLPYRKTATDTSLVRLGLELDKQAKSDDGETLWDIVKVDIGRFADHRVVAMDAPFGSGKTATAIDLAAKHFVVYCNPLGVDFEVKLLSSERVDLKFLARLLFLLLSLNSKPRLEPQELFREQTTTIGASTIRELVKAQRGYDSITIRDMLDEVQTKLHLLLDPKGLGLVIVLDEAQVAATGILTDKLISPFALGRDRNNLFDSKDQIQSKYRRGFLTPLSATLNSLQATLIPPAKRRKLSGRARFSIGIVNRLITTGSIQDAKQIILDNAIDYAIEHEMSGLRNGVRTLLEGDKTGDKTRLLSRMVLAYHLQDAKISFSSKQKSEFMEKALCSQQSHPHGIHLIMDEPMVVEAVVEELNASDCHQRGRGFIFKGGCIRTGCLVRRSLQRFSGFYLADLPFLHGIALPKWCNGLQLQIDEINAASGIGCTTDLDFLTKCPPNTMLAAASGIRADRVWFFSDKRYAGSLAVKLYSDPLPDKAHEENETSSDIRACFLNADGITVKPSFKLGHFFR
ncbi:hypothetical protein BGZ47_009366 [Haplosporangium gracile]|nr:hypothetical protein BGZ47_009366 [Haplosporangium gracile]